MTPEELSEQIVAILNDQTDSNKAKTIAQTLSDNHDITTLNFRFSGICNAQATILAQALRENKTITNICFSGNKIDTAGAIAIAQALRENTAITTLDLSSNEIGDAGIIAIAQALRENTSITILNLINNLIGAAGAIALAETLKTNKIITEVYLSNNQITEAGVAALAQALRENTSITTIHLVCNEISDAGATDLAEALKKNKIITEVYLNNNDIGNVGASALADALKKNTSIISFSLEGNKIGEIGAAALAEALRVNNTIVELYLEYNQIGNLGATALADPCKTNPSIAELNLQYNSSISPQCAGKILDTLLLPHTEITTQMLMLQPESYSKIRLALVDGTPNASAKIAWENIYHILGNNIRLNLSTTLQNSLSHKGIIHHDQRNRKITDQTKAYIDSRLAPDADHVKLSDIMYVLVYHKHTELQKYLAKKIKAEEKLAPSAGGWKIKGTILSNDVLCKFLFKQGPDLQVLNDHVYSVVYEYLDFWDIAKLCIAKLLPDQETEDLSTDTAPFGAAEEKSSDTLGANIEGTCPDV